MLSIKSDIWGARRVAPVSEAISTVDYQSLNFALNSVP